MSIWKKLSENPTLVSFHDDTLNMLTITQEYIQFRLSISSTTYSILEEDLKNVFLNPEENDLYIDMVFFNAKIDSDSILPNSVGSKEYYSILSLESNEESKIDFFFERESAPTKFFKLSFSYDKSIVKCFGEMPSLYYDSHGDIFNKQFDLQEFLKRRTKTVKKEKLPSNS